MSAPVLLVTTITSKLLIIIFFFITMLVLVLVLVLLLTMIIGRQSSGTLRNQTTAPKVRVLLATLQQLFHPVFPVCVEILDHVVVEADRLEAILMLKGEFDVGNRVSGRAIGNGIANGNAISGLPVCVGGPRNVGNFVIDRGHYIRLIKRGFALIR